MMLFFIVMIAMIFMVILKMYMPIFPGDIALARFIQGVVPYSSEWAVYVSMLSTFPGYFVLAGVSFISIWLLTHSLRAALFSFVSFVGILIIDHLMRLFIFIPRPSSDLIHVSHKLAGSSFPSTTALLYGATIGYGLILVLMKRYPFSLGVSIDFVMRIMILCVAFVARIVLGAHWPSDIMISYIISFLWMSLLMECLF
jgi:undecaprenyl-diphosphatase